MKSWLKQKAPGKLNRAYGNQLKSNFDHIEKYDQIIN